jgi:hypothetical protein
MQAKAGEILIETQAGNSFENRFQDMAYVKAIQTSNN